MPMYYPKKLFEQTFFNTKNIIKNIPLKESWNQGKNKLLIEFPKIDISLWIFIIIILVVFYYILKSTLNFIFRFLKSVILIIIKLLIFAAFLLFLAKIFGIENYSEFFLKLASKFRSAIEFLQIPRLFLALKKFFF